MSFVNSRIVKEIDAKLKVLLDSKGINGLPLSFWLFKLYEHAIEKDAALSSYRIESDNEDMTNFNTSNGSRISKKYQRYLIKAMSWGNEHFNPDNFDEDFVKNLALRVDPKFHKGLPAEYRIIGRNEKTGEEHYTNVRPGSSSCTPPYPAKIPQEMKKYIEDLKIMFKDGTLEGVLNVAIFSHLHLIRIHPFEDTNGRTARTLQRVILKTKQLPSPVIYGGERHDYYRHLDEAISGWRLRIATQRKHSSDGERVFFDYMAGKVSASLDRIIRSSS